MTVKELKEQLQQLPACYDDKPVVTMQAKVEHYFNGSEDEFRFAGFEDVELKRVHADLTFVRIN